MSAAPRMWTSKLGGRYPMDLIERLNDEHLAELRRLRKLPANRLCAECGVDGTVWASVNLGVFICFRCSDVHRGVGTHISKTKGCNGTYLWGPDEILRMQTLGNAEAVRVYGNAPVPDAAAAKEERLALCRQKYEECRWANKDHSAPVTDVSVCSRKTVFGGDFDEFFGDVDGADVKVGLLAHGETNELLACKPPKEVAGLSFGDFFGPVTSPHRSAVSRVPTAARAAAAGDVAIARKASKATNSLAPIGEPGDIVPVKTLNAFEADTFFAEFGL